MAEEDEVLILGVEYSTDCLCLSRNKKLSADSTTIRRRRLKKGTVDGVNRTSNGLVDEKSCFLIVDDKSMLSKDDDCVLCSGGREVAAELYPVIEDGGLRRSDFDNSAKASIVSPTPKRCKLPQYTDDSTNFLHINSEKHSRLSNNHHIGHWEGGHSQKESTNATTELQTHMVASIMSGETNPAHQFDSTSNHSALSTQLQLQELVTLAESKDHTIPSSDISHIAASLLTEPVVTVGSELQRTPKCWTNCPNCPCDAERKFHLIDVAINSAEWTFVSSQLSGCGFTVTHIKRIQNESLWQRLCYEKQLMLRERKDVNEQLLYHTSRSDVEIICEEGLDLRLSVNGNFGCGIYFSDDPIKCNNYWRGGGTTLRYMFCCRVLLGDIKVYPKGKAERLKREPPKDSLKPGDHNKYYDSVMGNLSGQNEFVVYNAYRVMPEYVLYYTITNYSAPPLSSMSQLQQCTMFNAFLGGPTFYPAIPQNNLKKKKYPRKRK